jgi:NAD(P)-dependent dehydrogenase (short-subunit alcohol dehydrogenase family)
MVTGASRDIGRSVAERFGKGGDQGGLAARTMHEGESKVESASAIPAAATTECDCRRVGAPPTPARGVRDGGTVSPPLTSPRA